MPVIKREERENFEDFEVLSFVIEEDIINRLIVVIVRARIVRVLIYLVILKVEVDLLLVIEIYLINYLVR